ncbi:MAG: hydrogenase maturation protease [Candidatus Binatia bacterium]
MSQLPLPVRVVGCGSLHGDDAVGWVVVEALGPRAGVSVHRVEGGAQLLDLLDGRGSVLLVDAVRSGAAPGTVHRLAWPSSALVALRPGSTHDLGVAAALELAATLGTLPERVIAFGIEAERLDPGTGLSAAVAASVPRVVAALGAELEGRTSRCTSTRSCAR